jgi:hypothetical protein
MLTKKFDDDEDFEEFEDEKIDEAPNEDNLESAMQVRDYSDRRVLLWEADDTRRADAVEVLSGLLTGAFVKGVASEAEAIQLLDAEPWDTFVVDFYTEGVSASEFVKRVNNYPDAILVALSLAPFTLPEERNRYKIEPLRKLFDIEKPQPKQSETPSTAEG